MEELMKILASLEFASPLYFWIGGAVILLLIFLPMILGKKKSLRFDLGYWSKKINLGSKKVWIMPILLVIISLLVATTLANPQIVEKRSVPFYGKPVMVVIDVSGSMGMEKEGEVSAFEQAREVFYDIIKQDLGATIGLVIFSDKSYIARDFTTKMELLRDTLENEEEIAEISLGTNIAKALRQSRLFLAEKTQAEDKSIILISDLRDNISRVNQEMRKVVEDGIKLYVIVVEEKPGLAYRRILVDENVKTVWSKDEAGIEQIYEEIRQMETSLTGAEEILSQKSLVPVFLAVIIGLVILSVVLSETILRKIP